MPAKHLFLNICAFALMSAIALPCVAQTKKVPCPAIIANKATKLYQTKKGLVCYSRASAAKKAGYSLGITPGSSCAPNVSPTPTPRPVSPVDVTSVATLDAIEMSGISYLGSTRYPQPGNTFRAYLVEVISDYALICSSYTASWFSLILSDGSEVQSFGNPSYQLPGGRLRWSSDQIPSQQTRRGWIVFEVPQGSTPTQIAFRVRATGFVASDAFKYVSVP